MGTDASEIPSYEHEIGWAGSCSKTPLLGICAYPDSSTDASRHKHRGLVIVLLPILSLSTAGRLLQIESDQACVYKEVHTIEDGAVRFSIYPA